MYLKHYQNKLNELEQTKRGMLTQMANRITKFNAIITIGNMQYYVCYHPENKNMLVPAYKYLNEHTDFVPIYDYSSQYEYGWTDFEEVCRILNVIGNYLTEKGF